VSGPLLLPSGRLEGTVRVPGSKSITNRALLVAALAPGTSVLVNPLESTDTAVLADILGRLGARVDRSGPHWTVEGPLRGLPEGAALNVGDAGTPARFLAALLSTLPGTYVLDGSSRMRERPMGPLVDALRSLGARIEALSGEGFLPLRIHGGTLGGGRVAIRGDVSSQFLSALLLVSPLVPGGIALDIRGPAVSAAYRELTKRTIAAFSGAPGAGYRSCRYRVPGDDSAACLPIAGALVSGGRVALSCLDRDSLQPDAVFRGWAAEAGGILTWQNDYEGDEGDGVLEVAGPPAGARALRPVVADVDPAPDAALPLAALVAFAPGRSVLSGVVRLREKESDRLAAALDLLARAGASARVEGGEAPRLVIEGAAGRPRAASFLSHGDHRVAMAAAVLALALPGDCTLDDPTVVAKSWPGFFSAWNALGAGRSSPG
jgi:3-phosphoshikimate 1-carboxyvinyltransferase